MDKDMNVTVTLSPEDIKKAIVRYVKDEFAGFTANTSDVSIRVEKRLTGYGPNEIEEAFLQDATVKVTKTETRRMVDNYQDRNMQSFQDK